MSHQIHVNSWCDWDGAATASARGISPPGGNRMPLKGVTIRPTCSFTHEHPRIADDGAELTLACIESRLANIPINDLQDPLSYNPSTLTALILAVIAVPYMHVGGGQGGKVHQASGSIYTC